MLSLLWIGVCAQILKALERFRSDQSSVRRRSITPSATLGWGSPERSRSRSSVRRRVARTRWQCGQMPTCSSTRCRSSSGSSRSRYSERCACVQRCSRMNRIRCRRRRTISFYVQQGGESFLFLEEILVEGAANGEPRPVKAALEGRLAEVHHVGGVLGREPLDVAQDQRCAVLDRQRANRPLED